MLISHERTVRKDILRELTHNKKILSLVRDVLQRFLIGLLDEERREDTCEHEEREDFQPSANPRRPISSYVLEMLSPFIPSQNRQTCTDNSQMPKERTLPRPAPDIDHLRESDLGDDRAELPARRRDAVRRRPVPRRECLPGDNERHRVGPKVLEEVREAIQEHERPLAPGTRVVHHPVIRSTCSTKNRNVTVSKRRNIGSPGSRGLPYVKARWTR